MPIYALGDRIPNISPEAFVSPDAVIIGSVTVGPESSVWPCAVLRGDHGSIVIGAQTSIQDGAVLHCTGDHDTLIGDRVTIGHNAHLEGCRVHDDCLIGSGSVVLPGADVGPHALVGACALVGTGVRVPANARALGVPARITESIVHAGSFSPNVDAYVRNSHWYRADLRRID